ncbi:MAG: TIGR04282 family arsenosugar biosynthesis glycosyltransferase [Proteobacteria bacterium]|nr:TIGR04282 family arsenosugar biosynthesis glycosyltransferase [Pseudomonadota bacterium]
MTYRYPAARILIFAKAPVPGKVKTRLVPALSRNAAAELHSQLTRRTVRMALASQLAPVDLYCSPDLQHALFLELEKLGVRRVAQTGRDLGERMYHALDSTLTDCDRVVLIGTDCPVMDCGYLHQAFQKLDQSDAVLGPAEDGGYVMIGMRRAEASVFEQIEWGSAQVLQQTRDRLRTRGLRWDELATLWDIDRYQDLQRWYPDTTDPESA